MCCNFQYVHRLMVTSFKLSLRVSAYTDLISCLVLDVLGAAFRSTVKRCERSRPKLNPSRVHLMTILKTMKGIIRETVKINLILVMHVERRPNSVCRKH